MTVVDDALGPRDVELLARMHVESLPESLVSRVGERYARAFYRYLARSNEERILVERDHGEVIAACIVSLAPGTLSRRLLVGTPLVPWLWRLPLRRLVTAPKAPPQPPGAEILLIFTVGAARGRGLGMALVRRTEDLLRAEGVDRLLVKTRDDPANRAIAFYERAGFSRVRSVTKLGKRLVLFEKPLAG